MVRIGVVGAGGRLGTALVAAIDAAEDLRLSAAADSGKAGLVLDHPSREAVTLLDSVEKFAFSTLDVVLEISSPESAVANATVALSNGCHVVIGTSGIGASAQAELGALAEERELGLLVVPNFALGGILLLRFAKEAARYFPSVEVIELHHPDKRDAPSGTATHTLAVLADAREAAGMAEPPDATDMVGLEGSRGGVGPGGIHVHSVRLRGLVAHEEILFGGPGEQLTLRHDSFDRTSFAAGALLALRSVSRLRGLTVGLDALLQQ